MFDSFEEIQKNILGGKTSCVELVEFYLKKIEETNHLNAYVEVYEQEAKERAEKLDEAYRQNPQSVGKLYGMVIAIKDVLCYKNHAVTAASKILGGFTSLFSSTAIERLLAEDAIIIGRLNCDEFAMGSSNENSFYGPVRNAADPTKVPGGSSGGSAVAVQANTCIAALGSDTGGSVRQPAAFCGVVGYKPSYGRISRHGLLAYASSFDCIGILAHQVDDVALLLETMAGADNYDSTASKKTVPAYSKTTPFNRKAKIAYFDSVIHHKSLDSNIKECCIKLMESLKVDGHIVEAVEFEYMDYVIPTYYVLTTAEASSNLARYDGVQFGYRSEKATTLLETNKLSRTEGFGTEVKRRIMLGTFVLSSGYYDAYYTKAQKVRRLIHDRIRAILQEYDFILIPTSPSPAFNIGEKMQDPLEMYLADIFTVQANLVGIPAISLPLSTNKNHLPIGVQFLADKFEDEKLLAFSRLLSKQYL